MSTSTVDIAHPGDGRYKRRCYTIARTVVSLLVALIILPIVLIGSVIYDLATRRTDLPTVRLALFGVVYLMHEIVGIVGALILWVRGTFTEPRDHDRLRKRQSWLIKSLLTWGRRLLRVELDLPDLSTAPTGQTIVLSRHASMVDAILPAHVFAGRLDRSVHYVIKRELLSSPIFDIYGLALENHFVARGADNTDQEVVALERLAADARPSSALVIFPEGTYATKKNRERVAASLKRRGETAALALAEELSTLLPPKPTGTLAMLRSQPDATVLIVGHVGLEGVAEFAGLRSYLPCREPIIVRWWQHAVSDLPLDDEGRTAWLQDQWRRLDTWVADQLTERGERAPIES